MSRTENENGRGNASSTWDDMKTLKKEFTEDTDWIEYWERFKTFLVKLLQEKYEFLQTYSSIHMFSLVMVAIWICIIVLVKIPRNWDTHWHHVYYFSMIILMGLALFRYDMENEVEDKLKNKKGKNTNKKEYTNGFKELEDFRNLGVNTKSNTTFYNAINNIKGNLPNDDNLDDPTCDNIRSIINTTNTKLNDDNISLTASSIYKNIKEHLKDIEKQSGCDLTNNEIKSIDETKKKNTIESIQKFKSYIHEIDSKNRKTNLEQMAMDSIKTKEKEEAKKINTRILPETLSEQIKVYFKYLAMTSCVVFLIFLLFLVYDGSGRNVRHGMHVLVGCLLIGLFLFFMYMISSKRQYLKVAWTKTDASIASLEDKKIKENNQGDNRGFFFLRLFTRPFTMMFYFLYGMMCNFRDFLKDMQDSKKRALSQKRFKKWKEQYLGYIVVIVVGLTFLFIQYVLPNLDKMNISFNSNTLLKEPVYLEKLKVIATDDKLNRHAGDNNGRDFSFSLSAWIYIENSNPNHNFASNMNATILNYGELPHLTYNVKTNTATIFIKKGKDVKHVIYQTTQLKKQKWNQFVFNYDHGVMDVFLNGSLVTTSTGIIPYMTNDDMYVGQAQGIRGGIKDVVYSADPRSKLSIEIEYYLSKIQSYLML